MKWFKHDSDASSDVKIMRLEGEFGLEGYAIYFKLLEIIAKEGENGRINVGKNGKFPKIMLSKILSISEEKLDEILAFLGRIHLCSRKDIKANVLYFPKFRSRADDYTKRLWRNSEHTPKNVPLEENRTEEIRIRKEQIDAVVNFFVTTKGYNTSGFSNSDWTRIQKAAKTLLIRTNEDLERVLGAIRWMSDKPYEWTLETVLKKMPDIQKSDKSDKVIKAEAIFEKA